MKIDLNDKVVRAVVQEYTNAIINFVSEEELNYDVHKFVHTFQVLETAQDLIKLSRIPLSAKVKKQILNGAVLHDIGRCHEYANGHPHKGYDHGSAGAAIIKKYFPKLTVESECTKWHNRQPTEKDPADLYPVLDYIRDADMLGNVRYNAQNIPLFMKHVYCLWKHSAHALELNSEIKRAAIEKRPCIYGKMEKFDFLDMMVAQLVWIYNLRTEAAFRYAKRFNVFSKFRDVVTTQVLSLMSGPASLKKRAAQDIEKLFPDSIFEEEFKRHGL